MSKQPKEKSTHLQELEAVFDRRTRRFSPFAVLGLNRPEKDSVDAEAEGDGAGGKDPPTSMWVPPTHMPHPPTPQKLGQKQPRAAMRMQDVLAVTQLKAQLGKKARQVLSYLNSLRSIERPSYTVPVGYTQICSAVDVHPHYLRREVLPKLTMLGLVGIMHKSLHGTVYHLPYDAAFLQLVASEEEEPSSPSLPEASEALLQPVASPPASTEALPAWVDREHWEWLTSEIVHQLVAKAGSEAQAQEKLEIVLYNETHGPVERRIRDRRSVLAHYLRTPQTDIW